VNEALARVRRRRLIVDMEGDGSDEDRTDTMDRFASSEQGPEQSAMGHEIKKVLEGAVAGLPAIYRSVFVLRAVEGMDVAETAACLGVSEETVKIRLHRARAMLRDELLSRAAPAITDLFPFHLDRCDRVVAAVFRRIDSGPPPRGTRAS
jgi:RNA polymerase sigma-70 factor, ECF subfamily